MPTLDFPSTHFVDGTASQMPVVGISHIQGEPDPETLVRLDFAYALAVMCFPGDHSKVTDVLNGLTTEFIHEAATEIVQKGERRYIESEVFLWATNNSNITDNITSIVETHWVDGLASAYILRWIIANSVKDKSKATLDAAMGVFSSRCEQSHRVLTLLRGLWAGALIARTQGCLAARHLRR